MCVDVTAPPVYPGWDAANRESRTRNRVLTRGGGTPETRFVVCPVQGVAKLQSWTEMSG